MTMNFGFNEGDKSNPSKSNLNITKCPIPLYRGPLSRFKAKRNPGTGKG